MAPHLDEDELIHSFCNGEESAVKHLFKLYYRSLCYYSERLIGNKTEAEDLAADTFIKLINKKGDFVALPEIKAFLFVTIRNACIDHLRRSKRQIKSGIELQYLNERYEQIGDSELIVSQLLQFIYVEVEALPSQSRQIFKAIFMEGKSTAVIAEEMDISPQTVLNQKAKALHKLRLCLQKEGLYSEAFFSVCLIHLASIHLLCLR